MCRLSSGFSCANCCKFFTWRFFDVNIRRWSSVTNGNCKNVLLNSHRPWIIIGDNFMQFSIVSMLGNFDTENQRRDYWLGKSGFLTIIQQYLYLLLRAYASIINWLTHETISWMRYGHFCTIAWRSLSNVSGFSAIRPRCACKMARAFTEYMRLNGSSLHFSFKFGNWRINWKCYDGISRPSSELNKKKS